MSKTCHKCPLWVKLRGTDKNTGEFVDEWRCSLGALPMLLIENASMVRAVDGNIDMLRKEQEAQHDEYKKYTAANIRAVQQVTTTILDNAPAQKLLPSGGSDADK
jgi:hypothetical protein